MFRAQVVIHIRGSSEYASQYIDGNDFLKVYSLGSELDPKHKTKIYFFSLGVISFCSEEPIYCRSHFGPCPSHQVRLKFSEIVISTTLTRPTMFAEGWQCWLLHWAGCARRETRRVFIVKTLC